MLRDVPLDRLQLDMVCLYVCICKGPRPWPVKPAASAAPHQRHHHADVGACADGWLRGDRAECEQARVQAYAAM
eukprot:352249-Chlamydomonas_euryale.AAC.19